MNNIEGLRPDREQTSVAELKQRVAAIDRSIRALTNERNVLCADIYAIYVQAGLSVMPDCKEQE